MFYAMTALEKEGANECLGMCVCCICCEKGMLLLNKVPACCLTVRGRVAFRDSYQGCICFATIMSPHENVQFLVNHWTSYTVSCAPFEQLSIVIV